MGIKIRAIDAPIRYALRLIAPFFTPHLYSRSGKNSREHRVNHGRKRCPRKSQPEPQSLAKTATVRRNGKDGRSIPARLALLLLLLLLLLRKPIAPINRVSLTRRKRKRLIPDSGSPSCGVSYFAGLARSYRFDYRTR